MEVINAKSCRPDPVEDRVRLALASITEAELRQDVEALSIPRHFSVEPENNRQVRDWIRNRLEGDGYRTQMDGAFSNVIARSGAREEAVVLVGAHYDSVAGCPGADDNASAIAALLACARCIARHAPEASICFAAFNREEDGLLGSTEFVSRLGTLGIRVHVAHVLEMVGYTDHHPGSQRLPPGLPIQVPDTGDFLGLVANRVSHSALDAVLTRAITYVPDLPVFGLKLPPGTEALISDLLRSDHAPFWAAGILALMWTDTSEYRNPHYHQSSDLPTTLDYGFLLEVTRLLTATLLMSRTPRLNGRE